MLLQNEYYLISGHVLNKKLNFYGKKYFLLSLSVRGQNLKWNNHLLSQLWQTTLNTNRIDLSYRASPAWVIKSKMQFSQYTCKSTSFTGLQPKYQTPHKTFWFYFILFFSRCRQSYLHSSKRDFVARETVKGFQTAEFTLKHRYLQTRTDGLYHYCFTFWIMGWHRLWEVDNICPSKIHLSISFSI